VTSETGSEGGLDVVGDVHGMIATYRAMLEELGYRQDGGRWSHPEGRRLVQLGDVVDRGPDPLGCLEMTREMVEAGVADFILGNHEVNALGWFVGARSHSEVHRRQFETTLRQIEADPARWEEAAAFLRRSPLWLERSGLRFIHAAWVPEAVAALPPTLANDDLVRETGRGGSLHGVIQDALKGPEHDVAEWQDDFGTKRRKRRILWWQDYPADEPTVCFGHYWFTGTPRYLGAGGNAVCLDYSCGRGGPLVAWRWPECTFRIVQNRDDRSGEG
jgi:Calcineurin-like phosphoesterase